jgi:elongation factor G
VPKSSSAPRVAALVGPYMSGKTTLLESMLFLGKAIPRKGTVKDGSTVGDPSAEAKARSMSVETSIVSTTYLGESWTLLDCPGSVDFLQDTLNTITVADAAVVVVEADANRAQMAWTILKHLADRKIPHAIFVNKVDTLQNPSGFQETIDALRHMSERRLVIREIPIIEGTSITGYVDLAQEKAFRFKAGAADEAIEIPADMQDEVTLARQEMLEAIGDLDDTFMEKLLEDQIPDLNEVYAILTKGFQGADVVPVILGSATQDCGVKRLLKILRHETPEPGATAARQGITCRGTELVGQVFKTLQAQHIGKQSFVRVWNGEMADNVAINGARPSGMLTFFGAKHEKHSKATVGEIVALSRMEFVKTGDTISTGTVDPITWHESLQPVVGFSLKAAKSGDEVKLSSALARLVEEDPSYQVELNHDTNERVLWGQGEIHLKIALDRLKGKFNVEVLAERPQVPFKETIRKGCEVHGRHKRQTGGHGQFGDVWFRIKPLERGEGVTFAEEIVGGVVPRNFIPAVEDGVIDYCKQGPLGFPVVDLSVTLYFGSYHDVDSSEMAFKTAARIGMQEGLPKCNPVLLEPILELQISVPSEHTAKAQRMITGHRAGQILGFDAKPGWTGWDVVNAYLPQSEMNDVIVELRSQTMGVGTFTWTFHHLQELEGRDADKIVEARKKALEA